MAKIRGNRKIHKIRKNSENNTITEIVILIENVLDLLVSLNLKSAGYIMDDDLLTILDCAIRCKKKLYEKKN